MNPVRIVFYITKVLRGPTIRIGLPVTMVTRVGALILRLLLFIQQRKFTRGVL